MRKKALIVISATLMVGSILAHPAAGRDYPTKMIEIVAPMTPGSPTDMTARLAAEIAPKYLGQPVVVVNKPGAGGSLGAAEVASSKPDGYKLLTAISNFFALTVKTQKIPYDPSTLTPVASFTQLVNGVFVRGDSPWKTFNELLEHGRKNPGTLRWSHTGRGLGSQMATLLMFKKGGVETIDIPYKGVPEKLAALLGGHVDAADLTYGTVKDQVRAGKIRLLVVANDRGLPDLPDAPSAFDLGFQDAAKLNTYCGLFMHKDTPEEIKKILIEAFRKTYEDPEFRKGIIEKVGDEPRFGGPEFMSEAIKRSEQVGVPWLKELGLYVGK